MFSPPLPVLLLALAPALPDAALPQWDLAQLTIHERIVVRIPAAPRARSPVPLPPTRWAEKKGPKCVAVRDLAGAIVSDDDQVDLVLRGGDRVRAKLDDACPALSYYGGFYLKPAGDGKVCADRDLIRSRSGGACAISRFRRLVPKH